VTFSALKNHWGNRAARLFLFAAAAVLAGHSADALGQQPSGQAVRSCPADMLPTGATCMDSTEVTQQEYEHFLATNPSRPQDATCGANSSFTPTHHWTPSATPDAPVVGVDWCDATAFCSWQGKRLCGGVSQASPDAWRTGADEWFAECRTVDPAACAPVRGARPPTVGSSRMCVSASGIHDLLGSVYEWVADCTSGEPNSECLVRGGSWLSGEESRGCAAPTRLGRLTSVEDVGIRCCAD